MAASLIIDVESDVTIKKEDVWIAFSYGFSPSPFQILAILSNLSVMIFFTRLEVLLEVIISKSKLWLFCFISKSLSQSLFASLIPKK